MRRATTIVKGLALLLLAFSLAGCDAFEDLLGNEKEAQGIVEALGDHSLTVDGIEYRVTDQTEYEGIDGLADLSVGDEVEIEYKESGGSREAVEIELAGSEDDD